MKRIKQFITKSYNKDKDAYCWYNTNQLLTPENINDLKEYFKKKPYNIMIIINGCSEQRPQRTWCEFPTFLKGLDGCHLIFKNSWNAFILCSWLQQYDEYEEHIRELLSTIPDELELIVLRK